MTNGLRRDIQFLRGIAVFVVVLFHADIGIFKNGYLGVDIFFVISGFLITGIILRDLENKTFSFTDFYLRRAKRLLPALYSTLIFTTISAYLFISPSQVDDYIHQLIGAVSFLSNVILPMQVGYFESNAESKPLLHIWSLSLEEQYYFTLPLILFLIPKHTRLYALIALFLISIVWCFTWLTTPNEPVPILWRLSDSTKAEWAFYLFPTRAWELLAGSICAWIMMNKPISISPSYKIFSFILIIIITNFSLDSTHPRGDALMVVILTAILLIGSQNWLSKNVFIKAIERIGDWSYSVYLVHWPLFSFAYIGYLSDVPDKIKVFLVITSLVVGFLQFRYVEEPFRFGWKKSTSATWTKLGLSTLLVVIIPMPLAYGTFSKNIPDFTEIRAASVGLSDMCDQWMNNEAATRKRCTTSPEPTIAVWGDSFAMHLVPGLRESNDKILQLTKSACGPILGLSPVSDRRTVDWARECSLFNDSAFDLIIKTASIKKVVLSSAFTQYFSPGQKKFLMDSELVTGNRDFAQKRFASTVNKLLASDKIPIIVSPPPRSGVNIGECLEREATNRLLFRESCDISFSDYIREDGDVILTLKNISLETGAQIIWISDFICNTSVCQTKKDGVPLYRDTGHLTINGSRVLFSDVKLQ